MLREYFWHIMILLCIIVMGIFAITTMSLRFNHRITFTDNLVVAEPAITIADPLFGDLNAPVTIVTYSDYACPGCASLDATLLSLATTYPETIRLVWKDMPNETRHAEAFPAAIAARCAGKQGKFWEYHTLLFTNQAQLGESLYSELATEVRLDVPTFISCTGQDATRALVERTLSEGLALEVTATPTIFINNTRYTGTMNATDILAAVDRAKRDL